MNKVKEEKSDELEHELYRMRSSLEAISEYWNGIGIGNDRVMDDTLYWIIDKAVRAFCKHKEREELFAKHDSELAITFLNNDTGSETVGNYLVTVSANGNMIYQRSFRGHLKANGWRQLLWDFVETEIDKDEEAR